MTLENLVLGRVCLHEVHRRADDKTIITPTYSTELLSLPDRAKQVFVSRIIAAFKSSAQCMEMAIRSFGDGSVVARGCALLEADDANFVLESKLLADSLAEAQSSRQIPGGLVVAFDGTVGHPARAFFGVMKAELHEGFLKTRDLQATFVSDLFLSPKTKLYKIGLFISDGVDPRPALPAGWSATVYDSTMTAAQRENAAHYFHSRFLGLELPENSAHQVKRFFEITKAFIKSAPVSEEKRVDLYNSLYTYLKVDLSPTIQVAQFAETYCPIEIRDQYRSHMRDERFPDRAVPKDLSEVSGNLKLRKLRFPSKITLSGPPEAMKELVEVETIDGHAGQRKWTLVTVRGPIEGQE